MTNLKLKLQEVLPMSEIFTNIPEIRYEGPDSKNAFAFKYYDPEKVVLGKKKRLYPETRNTSKEYLTISFFPDFNIHFLSSH